MMISLKGIQELDSKTSGYYTATDVAVGEVVKVQSIGSGVEKATAEDNAVGIVKSTTPESAKVEYVGRMQVKVSEENGAINPGDKLMVSSLMPGYAAKMTTSGNTIGTALEASAGGVEGLDMIEVSVSVGYHKIHVAQNQETGSLMAINEDMNFNGFGITNVSTIASINDMWSIDALGNLAFKGHLTVGADVAGSIVIPPGATEIVVNFETPYEHAPKVTATPSGDAGSFWIGEKTESGFKIFLKNAVSSALEFDWHALGVTPAPSTASEVEPSSGGSEQGTVEPPVEEGQPEGEPEPEVVPEPTPEEEPAPEPTPEVEPEPEVVPEPTPEPTPEPAPQE